MRCRIVCRFANVTIGHETTDPAKKDAKCLGEFWNKILTDLNLYCEFKEFEGEFDDPIPEFGLPQELGHAKFDTRFPVMPLYVGYSKDVAERQKDHQRSKFLI